MNGIRRHGARDFIAIQKLSFLFKVQVKMLAPQQKVDLTSGHSGSVLVLHPLVPGTQNLIFSSWEYADNYDHDASLAWPNTGFDASKINMIFVGHVHPEQGDPVDPDGCYLLCSIPPGHLWDRPPTTCFAPFNLVKGQ